MARKEEIERKAKIRSDQYSHPVEWNDCYHHWIEGAEWADKTMLNKVYEWLKEHMYFSNGISNGEVYYPCNSMESFINDLKQAMEE